MKKGTQINLQLNYPTLLGNLREVGKVRAKGEKADLELKVKQDL
jgi:hypothetical protein